MLDRSFVARLGPGGEGAAMMATGIDFAHTLDLETVAEAVETPSQLVRVKEPGCGQVRFGR